MLRQYQSDVVDAVGQSWRMGNSPVIVLPTGAGKSHVAAELVRRLRAKDDTRKCLVLAHRKELLEQNAQKISLLGLETAIYSAGLGRKELAAVTVAGIQSLARAEDLDFDVVIVDEAHRVPKKDEGQYRETIARIAPKWVCGMSATPWRLGGGRNSLITGEGSLWNQILWGPKISDLQKEGFLCKLITRCGKVTANCERMKKQGGEFTAQSAEEEMILVLDDALDDAIEKTKERFQGIVFTPGVGSAEKARVKLDPHGGARLVTSETPNVERAEIISDFKAGKFKWLTNCMIALEGLDVPAVDCIVMCRPTQSATLYCQAIGRGLRPSPGKADCLVLDYAGNAERFGPLDKMEFSEVQEQELGKKTHFKCPSCGTLLPYKQTSCECGWVRETAAKGRKDSMSSAFEGDLVLNEPQSINIMQEDYYPHESKNTGRPCIRIDYRTEVGKISQWIVIENKGFLAKKMQEFFMSRCRQNYWPRGMEDGTEWLMRNVKTRPTKMRARKNGKFWEILNFSDWVDVSAETDSFDRLMKNVEDTWPNSRIDWNR